MLFSEEEEAQAEVEAAAEPAVSQEPADQVEKPAEELAEKEERDHQSPKSQPVAFNGIDRLID